MKLTGLLGEAEMTRTLAALAEFANIARDLRVGSFEPVGTMAVRIAQNQSDFLSRAASQDTPVTVLSGDDEARLGFLAVADDPLFADFPRLSIVDPGGNSTELATADRTPTGWVTQFRKSYDVGALGLRDGVLQNESPDFKARLAAVQELDAKIGMDYLPGQSGTVVVLGATGTNLVSIREKLTDWNPDIVHGAILDYEEVGRAVGVGWSGGRRRQDQHAVAVVADAADPCLAAADRGEPFVLVVGHSVTVDVVVPPVRCIVAGHKR